MVSADISASLGFICAKLKVLLFVNGSLFYSWIGCVNIGFVRW